MARPGLTNSIGNYWNVVMHLGMTDIIGLDLNPILSPVIQYSSLGRWLLYYDYYYLSFLSFGLLVPLGLDRHFRPFEFCKSLPFSFATPVKSMGPGLKREPAYAKEESSYQWKEATTKGKKAHVSEKRRWSRLFDNKWQKFSLVVLLNENKKRPFRVPSPCRRLKD